MKKIFFSTGIVATVVLSLPLPVSAAVCAYSGSPGNPGSPGTFSELLCLFFDLVTFTIPIVASLTLLIFFWGLAKFIKNSADSKSHETGKNLMIWGTVGLFVMVSVWALVRMVYSDFFGSGPIGIPRLPFS
jgi:hypothetical protein